MIRSFSILLFVLLYSVTRAQGLPNDCIDYIQVCGNYDISLDVSGAGVQEINFNACNSYEHNSLWLRFTVEESGTLGFVLAPESPAISEDYDFWVFGPDVSCDNLGQAIRCSTTNPSAAGQSNNHTGLNESSTDVFEGPGPDGDSFLQWLDVVAGETYFLVIDRPIGYSSFNLTWTGSAILENPLLDYELYALDEIHICDNDGDGYATYDFSIWDTELITPFDDIIVTYHSTETDATVGSNPLTYPDEVYEGTYYARIAHVQTRCFDITPIQVVLDGIFEQHTVHNLEDILVCDNDNDGFVTYDFSVWNDVIVEDSSQIEISYYASEIDAENGDNPLSYPAEVQERSYFVRIVDNITGCFTVISVDVVIQDLFEQYEINQIDDVYLCDMDDNGVESYDFSLLNDNLVDDLEGLQVSYHNTETEATDGINALTYPADVENGTYYIRLYHADSQCRGVVPVNVILDNPLSTYAIQAIPDIYICDNDVDGNVTYDFSVLNQELIDSTQNIDISYHANQNDAASGTNALSYPADIQEGTYHARILHVVSGCYVTMPINILLDDIGQHYSFNDLETIFVCDSDLDGVELYDFSLLNNDLVHNNNNLSFSYYISASDAHNALNPLTYPAQIQQGTYFARIEQNDTSCYKVIPISIDMSNFEIDALEVIDENQITVITDFNLYNGIEFSLDDGSWQSSHIFTDVSNGLHTVQMRYGECLSEPFTTYILAVYNVITPNGDGLNDVWAFPGLNEFPGSRVVIYDRYGKELLNLSGDKPFVWDGKYNGRPLPSTSYWYKIVLPDGREQRGYITIKN